MTEPEKTIDWTLTTWEGSQQEQYRRWSELPLEKIIMALEEMEEISDCFREQATDKGSPDT